MLRKLFIILLQKIKYNIYIYITFFYLFLNADFFLKFSNFKNIFFKYMNKINDIMIIISEYFLNKIKIIK